MQPNQEQSSSSVEQPVVPTTPEQYSSPRMDSGGSNPLTGSLNRKGYLIWNIALTLLYFAIRVGVSSVTVLIAFYVVAVVLSLLLVVRRMQNTGLSMLLLLALLLPLANVALIIALFFIPPNHSASGAIKPGASKGFKIAMSIVLLLFVIFAAIILRGLLF